jgi:ribonuclease E
MTMGSKMLIDASHAEETRVVVLRGNRIEEFDFESASRKQLKGNIYLAKVTRVEPSLQAAFVEYGGNRHGFLAFSEIHPDYYQIPVADRQALLREQEEADAEDAAAEEDEDDSNDKPAAATEESHANNGDSLSSETISADSENAGEEGSTADPENDDHAEASAEAGPTDTREAADESDAVPTEPPRNGIETVEEDAEARKVESVGAVDALEEVPQRPRRAPRRHYKIQEVIKRRQIILVQVVKEERGNKGAALTTYLSLAGRYCVLMPNTARGGGISRKITDAGDRRRLKEVARDVEIPQGMGLIVRTAGAQRTRPEIKRDFDYLMRLWENVRDLTLQSTAPALVYEEGSLIKRSIRDLYTKDVDEVHVEGEAGYREAKDFMRMLMPSHARNVKLYKDSRPLFAKFQVETQLDSLFSPTVTLPSGGYIVLNQTEALVSVDINSGKATREHNIEDTALKTNLEACDEIARQLRLRDLAGLVVIDFIDMEENRNNRSVERRLKEALKHDRARIQVGRISHFGLMEMSRQRLRPGLLEGTSRPCPHCEGRGIVRSISSCGLSVLRAIEDYLQNKRAENITAKVARDVAFYVLNEKRDNLLAIEHSYGISVFLTPSDEMKGSQTVIERAGERNIVRRFPMLVAKSEAEETAEPDDTADEEIAGSDEAGPDMSEVADDSSQEDETDAGSQQSSPEGRGRRRRRGRRGSRRGREERSVNGDAKLHTGESEIGENDAEPQDEVSAGSEIEPVAALDGGVGEAADADTSADDGEPREQEPRRGRRGRRDRWGRNRDGRPAGRNGQERRAESQAEAPEDSGSQADKPGSRAPETPALEPVVQILSQPVEARKWTPPAPTVVAEGETAPRKSGWWSRRGG